MSASGAQQEGTATQQMYNYRAQVAKINAGIDKQNAEWSRTKGEMEAGQYGQKAAQQMGQIKVAQAASGLDVNTGSAARVQKSQSDITRMDLSMIRANAGKIAYDYETKSVMDENQATLDVMAGKNAKRAGEIKAASSILGTVGTVASKWQQGKSTGLWGSEA
jgi:hypothetical protein